MKELFDYVWNMPALTLWAVVFFVICAGGLLITLWMLFVWKSVDSDDESFQKKREAFFRRNRKAKTYNVKFEKPKL